MASKKEGTRKVAIEVGRIRVEDLASLGIIAQFASWASSHFSLAHGRWRSRPRRENVPGEHILYVTPIFRGFASVWTIGQCKEYNVLCVRVQVIYLKWTAKEGHPEHI